MSNLFNDIVFKRTLFAIVLLIALIEPVTSCGGGGGGGNNDGNFPFFPLQGLNFNGAVIGVLNKIIKETFGGDMRVEVYDGAREGPISCASDLDCTFDEDCRWDNVKGDKWEYLQGMGQPDPNGNWSVFMGTPETPDEPYIMTASRQDDEANAFFASDPVPNQPGDGTVRLRLWKTPLVMVRVCVRDVGGAIDQSKCYAPSRIDGKSREATFPIPGPINKEFELVLLTDNYKLPQGGIVVIDDIRYESELCGSTPRPTESVASEETEESFSKEGSEPSESRESSGSSNSIVSSQALSDASLCGVQCGFEGGSCGYSTNSGFKQHRGSIGNRITGIHYDKNDQPIREGYLMADNPATGLASSSSFGRGGTKHVAKTKPVSLSGGSARYLQFDSYTAKSGMKLKVCLKDEVDCLETYSDVKREWVERRVLLPQRNEDVPILFVVEDMGRNGYAGIDNVEITDGSGRSIC